MPWHIVNSITGALIGRLPEPKFEVTEPLRGQGSTGMLRIAFPQRQAEVDDLREWLRPDPAWAPIRSIVWEYGAERSLLFGGPIPYYPYREEGGDIVVPLMDWRAWFYHTHIRPTGSKLDQKRATYKVTNRDQARIQRDLAAIALEGAGDPLMVLDDAPDTNVDRSLTIKMLQGESIGAWLDDIMNRDKGSEWFTYMTESADQLSYLPHFAVAWPERGSYSDPITVEWNEGKGGNASGYSWPPGGEVPTRLIKHDGGEDIAAWGVYTDPGVATGTQLLWEEVSTLEDNTMKKAEAFKVALGDQKKLSGRSREISMTLVENKLAFDEYQVGDRFRVILSDRWETPLDVPAARCTQRVLTGGGGDPNQQVLTFDIVDNRYPTSSHPGTVRSA